MRARQFLRVSTGHQEEQKQVADVAAYIEAQGYEDDGRAYLAHGKSAYKGKHLPVLDEALADMAAGQYDVLVMWDSSRFTRMGVESIFTLMAKAREAGGRIQFAAAHAQGLNHVSDWTPVMLALQATADKMESDRKAAHTLRDISKHKESGSVHGRPPWGFRVEGPKDGKRFVPTSEGREWVPKVYAWAIAGKGGLQIARALTEAGAGGGKRWSEAVVCRIIANPIYYGARRNGGNLETEALVDYSTWQAAVAALESRRRGGRGALKYEPSLLKPVCGACYGEQRDGCANGISIMYSYRYPDRPHVPYYRCCGSGPQRKGCGARLVPAKELDAIVLERYSWSSMPHWDRVFVPGRNTAEELRDLNRQIAEAAAQGDYAAVAVLSTKAQEVSQAEDARGRWELVDTGLTRGAWFRSLDREGQRAYLAEEIILAERAMDGQLLAGEVIVDDDGGAVVSRWG